MRKLIVNFTPTGMVPTREMTPHVPLQPPEIVEDVLRCAELGASVVHLHARDAEGVPTWRKEVYAEIIAGIRRERPDLVLGVSTSGRNTPELERRCNVLELDGPVKPDMASLTLSSLNFARSASLNAPDTVKALASRMLEKGIKPELEVFDLGMANYARYLEARGLLRPPHYVNVLLGGVATAQDDLLSVATLIERLPGRSEWALAGMGASQHRAVALAIAAGGHVRVGLEDNLYLDAGRTRLATNAQLVEHAVGIAQALAVPIATPAEAREIIGLPLARGA